MYLFLSVRGIYFSVRGRFRVRLGLGDKQISFGQHKISLCRSLRARVWVCVYVCVCVIIF